MVKPASSWIIAKDDNALWETFDRQTAEYAEAKGYTAHPAGEWLGLLNARIRSGAPA